MAEPWEHSEERLLAACIASLRDAGPTNAHIDPTKRAAITALEAWLAAYVKEVRTTSNAVGGSMYTVARQLEDAVKAEDALFRAGPHHPVGPGGFIVL